MCWRPDSHINKIRDTMGSTYRLRMNVSDTHRLKSLEDENAKLKRLLADTMLDNVVLKDLLGKN